MNTIPWYRSPVFVAGLLAFLTEVASILDSQVLSGKYAALGHSIAALLMAIVVAVRTMASAQPITLTQADADEANAVAYEKRQRGFARPLLLALLLATAVIALPVLQGCQALALQQARTFNQRYAYAMGQTTAVREAATAALNAGQISIADAEYAQQIANQSRELLDAAKLVADTGKSATADNQVLLAIGLLTKLQAYLNQRQSPDESPKR